MRRFALVAVLLLGCSDDAPTGDPAGLTAGGSGQAGSSGSTTVAGGASGATASPGGSGGQASETAGQAGQEAGGSDAGQGGQAGGQACNPGTVAECPCPGVEPGTKACLSDGSAYAACECPKAPVVDCESTGQCSDGRALYSCKSDTPPSAETCLRHYPGTNFCCGDPSPATCKADKRAGATRIEATFVTGTYHSLPANAEGWLKSTPQDSGKIEGKVGAYPLALDSVEICVGGRCDDGIGGTTSCEDGALTKVGDVSLCCVKGDYASSGSTPKATVGCKSGKATTYLRVKDLLGSCRDLSPAQINGI